MSNISEDVSPDRHIIVFIVTLALTIVAAAFTGLRLLSKGWIVRRYTLDDWFTVASWIFSLGVAISVMVGAQKGLGKIDAVAAVGQTVTQKRAIYSFTVFYNLAIMMTKTAILLLYIRMASAYVFLRRASIAIMTVVNLAGTMLVLLNIFRCRPIRAAFSSEQGTCINLISMFLSASPINILTDLAILLLPLPILTRLRIEFREKVVLVTTFAVGGFVTIVDVVRVVYLQNALKSEYNGDNSGDPNAVSDGNYQIYGYHISYALMWSSIEVSVGLMCCCALVLKPLVLRLLPAILKDPNKIFKPSVRPSVNGPDDGRWQQTSTVHPLLSEGQFSAATEETSISNAFRTPGITETQPQHDPEQMAEGETFDLFSMLVSDPPAANGPTQNLVGHNRTVEQLPAKGHMIRKFPIFFGKRKSMSTSNTLQEPTQVFFDFVHLGGKKPLTELSGRESRCPVMFGSTLFFLWGFGYGLINSLNDRVHLIHNFSQAMTLALNCSYWIGYLVGPPSIAYWILTRRGFKVTFITGLAIYSAGAMAFWPSAILASYTGFFISNFIIAVGLSTLETAANPFIAIAGPSEMAEARLLFSQAIQAIGGLISPIIASKLLFKDISEKRLFNVQWCYLAVAISVQFLAVIFFYVPLSEASDHDLETLSRKTMEAADITNHRKWRISIREGLLVFATVMMWFYIGAQETIFYYWPQISALIKPSFNSLWAQVISHGTFCLGRILASILCFIGIPPRFVLFGHVLGTFIVIIIAIIAPPGNLAYASLILTGFFESGTFPLLFAMGIRNQGRHTKRASTFLVMATNSGAVWPAVAYAINLRHHGQSRRLLLPSAILNLLIIAYPALLSTRRFRRWVDPKWGKKARDLSSEKREESASGNNTSRLEEGRKDSSMREESLGAPLTMGLGLDLFDQPINPSPGQPRTEKKVKNGEEFKGG
ncbi:hypothetical protein L204_106338 [Cryptococcus depauperatus]